MLLMKRKVVKVKQVRLPIISSYTNFAGRSASFSCCSSHWWTSSIFLGEDTDMGGWPSVERRGVFPEAVGRCCLGCFVMNIPSSFVLPCDNQQEAG